MQSFRQKPFYSFRADANALGGFLEEPFHKVIPTLAPVSLPAVGGFATARSEAFNLDEIVSCSSAYSRVSGTEHHADGSISILATAVVEDLNLLEVVTAERVVAQVSISIPAGSSGFQISLTGSRFEGLRLAGRPCRPILNSELIPPGGLPLTWQNVQKAGQSQAKDLIAIFKARGDKDAEQWAQKQHGWMTANPTPPADGGKLLCSLVNGVEGNDGHVVEIPGFGRIFLGELRVSYDSVQLVAIRAELGCPVKGKVGICSGGGGGTGEN
jgi:hypothetical protein